MQRKKDAKSVTPPPALLTKHIVETVISFALWSMLMVGALVPVNAFLKKVIPVE